MLQVEYACISPLSILKQALEPAVFAAGRIVKQYAEGNDYQIKNKSGISDFVTDIDMISSAAISEILNERYPEIEVLDEEHQSSELSEMDRAFIVDPIDGTLNFIYGLPEFCISIGYIEHGKPLAGAVFQPMTQTLYTGVVGVGAWKNSTSITIGRELRLKDCLIATGIPYDLNIRNEAFIDPVARLMNRVQEIRCFGSAALALCYVASNQLSGFYEYGLNPWDVAGGAAIVLGAGGTVSTIEDGGNVIFGNSIVAANTEITNRLCEILIEIKK